MAAIYLDYNATTPLDPRVFEVMKEWYLGPPSNAGSRTHIYGQNAKNAVEKARAQVASVINAKPEEIIFTSGATESNNVAILGLAAHGEASGKKHIVSTTIEHKAVLEPLEFLATKGFEIELAPVGSGGFVDPDDVVRRCRRDTLLVSIMHANNETGVIQPINDIATRLDDTEIFFHTDAAQTFGKEVDELRAIPCDFMSISGHKIYGPQGVGGLYIRRRGASRGPTVPILFGGGQERSLRPGTIPVAIVVGLGVAANLAQQEHAERRRETQRVKDQVFAGLLATEHLVNGDVNRSQPHVLNVSFPGVDSEALMMALRDAIAISNGSACTSASYNPSHVLLALGMDEDRISESVRISWGPGSDVIPIDVITSAVDHLRVRF